MDLTSGYDYEDNVVFHLKQLLKKDWVEKANKRYQLTVAGLKEISQYNLQGLVTRGTKSFFVGFFCENSHRAFLLKSHPQAEEDFYNLPGGKPGFGEPLEEFLVRKFYDYTRLDLSPDQFKLVSLHMKTIRSKRGEVLFDDAFAIYHVVLNRVETGKAELSRETDWYTRRQINSLEKKWPEVDICISRKKIKPYQVYSVTSDYIL